MPGRDGRPWNIASIAKRWSAKLLARPAQKGREPNDRGFSRQVQGRVKRMDPEDLDRLLRGED